MLTRRAFGSRFMRCFARISPAARLAALYAIYTMWCSDNAYKPRSARTVSMTLKKHAEEFGLEHDNHIQNALGKRVNGFWGIEALVAPPVL